MSSFETFFLQRGGAHLGSIQITGAQIGRQQKTGGKGDADDDNEFRHAFLIIEQKRGPAGQNTRHVLCAESDQERDAWVDVLVRYVLGSYNEDEKSIVSGGLPATGNQQNGVIQPRASTSSLNHSDSIPPSYRRVVLKDQIQKSDATPVPISQLAVDETTAKFFPSLDPASPTKSPADKGSVASLPSIEEREKSSLDRISGEDAQQSSSLPVTSHLSEATPTLVSIGQRSTSELGHYPDLQGTEKPSAPVDSHRARERARASYFPNLGTTSSSYSDRPASPEKSSPAAASPLKEDATRLGKISGPLNGAPIPPGYKFGGKDPVPEQQSSNERERKVRSRAFWKWSACTYPISFLTDCRVHL